MTDKVLDPCAGCPFATEAACFLETENEFCTKGVLSKGQQKEQPKVELNDKYSVDYI